MQNYYVIISYATYIARTQRFNTRTRHFNTRTPFFNTFKQKSRKRSFSECGCKNIQKIIEIPLVRGYLIPGKGVTFSSEVEKKSFLEDNLQILAYLILFLVPIVQSPHLCSLNTYFVLSYFRNVQLDD